MVGFPLCFLEKETLNLTPERFIFSIRSSQGFSQLVVR